MKVVSTATFLGHRTLDNTTHSVVSDARVKCPELLSELITELLIELISELDAQVKCPELLSELIPDI